MLEYAEALGGRISLACVVAMRCFKVIAHFHLGILIERMRPAMLPRALSKYCALSLGCQHYPVGHPNLVQRATKVPYCCWWLFRTFRGQ